MKIPTKNIPLNMKKTYLDSYFGGQYQFCAFTVTEPRESSRKSSYTLGLVINDKKHEN